MKPSSDHKLLAGVFFRLLPYQMLLIVITAINGIVDSLYASNGMGSAELGEKAMSAIGLYSPLNHFLYAASIMLVSGSQLLYGRYLGKEPEKIRGVFSVDLVFSACLSVLTSLILVLAAATNLTRVLVSDPAEHDLLKQYIFGQSVGIPALVLGQQLFAFLSLENRTKRTMIASLSCFLSNVAMNYVFVVLLDMKTLGLGLGSSAGLWVFFGVQAHWFLSGKSELKFSFRACRRKEAFNIVKLGYSGAISRFVEMFRCIIVNILVLKYVGSVGLSAFAASNSFLAIIWSLPFGMVAVARMLFSIYIGEEDRRSLADTMRVVFRYGVPLMCIVSALLVALAEPLTQLFYQNSADRVYELTVMGFRLLPLCMPLAVISLNFACYAQAARKKLLSILLPVTDGFAGVVLCSLFLIPAMAPTMNGLYLANILNGFICFALIFVYAWIERKRVPKDMEGLLAIPDDFGADDDQRLDITVREMPEVLDVSRRVIAFCRERGIDPTRSNYVGLALEELATNVVSHGFVKDNKKHHSADIRVVHMEDGILLRIRDDCVPFNPSDRAQMLTPDDPVKNIGIRLVFKIAKEVRYQNLLGLNVLTVRI
ncbi:MAG: ATP-binding protein [Clostridia bacterium]|nr:ATP-binding protein [Clostridia bacterium]